MLCVCFVIFPNYLHPQSFSLFSPFPSLGFRYFILHIFLLCQIWTVHLFQIPCYAIITIYTQYSHLKCKLQKLAFQSTMQFCLLCKSALSFFPQT